MVWSLQWTGGFPVLTLCHLYAQSESRGDHGLWKTVAAAAVINFTKHCCTLSKIRLEILACRVHSIVIPRCEGDQVFVYLKNLSYITVQFKSGCNPSRRHINVQWICTLQSLKHQDYYSQVLKHFHMFTRTEETAHVTHVDYFHILNQSQPFVFYPPRSTFSYYS